MKRLQSLDAWRGFAIIGMVVYHFLFDLDLFSLASIDFNSLGLVLFARVIQFSFLIVVGVSSYLVYRNSKTYSDFINKQFRRFFAVGGFALLVTLVTMIFYSDRYIGFGILHLIAFAILVLTFIARYSRSSTAVISLLIVVVYLFTDQIVAADGFAWIGYRTSDFQSLDYFPVVPWLSLPLFGYAFGPSIVRFLRGIDPNMPKWLSYIGRKSLLVYVLHQPFLFFCIFLYTLVIA